MKLVVSRVKLRDLLACAASHGVPTVTALRLGGKQFVACSSVRRELVEVCFSEVKELREVYDVKLTRAPEARIYPVETGIPLLLLKKYNKQLSNLKEGDAIELEW
ncbi:MAG: hypothetical protein ACE5Z5_13950 [Candidatus Bathyarchaeia archaeon]